jgi:hypothetical protein
LVRADLFGLKNLDLSGPYVGRAKIQLDRRLPARSVKVNDLLEHVFDWIVVERIIHRGRREIHQRIHEQITRRMFEPELSVNPVDPRLSEHAMGRCLGQSFPEQSHRVLRFLASANGQAMGEHDGIDGAGA